MASLEIANVEGDDVEMNIEDSYLTDEVGDMVKFEEDFMTTEMKKTLLTRTGT